MKDHVPMGWAGSNSYHSPRSSISASIQSLMVKGPPPGPSAYTSIRDDMNGLADSGSNTSVAIKPELFTMPVSGSPSPQGPSPQGPSPQSSVGPSPQASNAHFRSAENFNNKVDPISGGETSHKRHHPYPNHVHGHGHSSNHHHIHHGRSASAKPMARPHSMYDGRLPPELSTSVGHMGHGGTDHHNHISPSHDSGPEVRCIS